MEVTTAADDLAARDAAHQILGDDYDHVYSGDWHQTLREATAAWTTDRNTEPTQTA